MRENRSWFAILGAFFVLTAGYLGCTGPDQRAERPQLPAITSRERHALLTNYLCPQAAKEDADNGGVRANGKPWTLEDLVADTGVAYAKRQLHTDDVAQGRKMIAAALTYEPTSISLAELCRRAGTPLTTSNQSVKESLAKAIAIATK